MSEQSETSVAFREATPTTVEAPADVSVGSKSATTQMADAKNTDVPPSLYKHIENKSYAIKHLSLDIYADDPDFQDVRENAAALDKYVLDQMKALGLKDTADSYREVVDAIYKQIGRSKNEDGTKSLKRLATAADAIQRLEKAKLPATLSASNLTPQEFEDIQP